MKRVIPQSEIENFLVRLKTFSTFLKTLTISPKPLYRLMVWILVMSFSEIGGWKELSTHLFGCHFQCFLLHAKPLWSPNRSYISIRHGHHFRAKNSSQQFRQFSCSWRGIRFSIIWHYPIAFVAAGKLDESHIWPTAAKIEMSGWNGRSKMSPSRKWTRHSSRSDKKSSFQWMRRG
jgi:hypothetical protein